MKKYLFIAVLAILASGCAKKQQTTEQNEEQYRPQVHFTPDSMWMNDPNGMVYYDGEYHLFYQYYPDSTIWGPMHWGHAISTDLVHWDRMPVALYPDSLGWIFSGSAVADVANTSGLGTSENPPLVAIYTYHNPELERSGSDTFQYQGVAYSIDKGRSWTKYEHNPVLPNPGIRDFRDPKVFWHEASESWMMILAVQNHVSIYSSPNLIDWTFESDFGEGIGAHGGVWECPDLFPMQAGDTTKWVMLVSINPGGPNGGSATQYFVGDFDGHVFTPEGIKTKWVDYGKDNYAGVTWSNVPGEDGRRLFMGWLNNWQYANQIPTGKWRGAMTVARELELVEVYNDYLLVSKPVDELQNLRGVEEQLNPETISGEMEIKKAFELPLEINLHFDTKNSSTITFAERFGIALSNENNEKLLIGYDNLNKLFFIDRTNAGWDSLNKDFAGIHYAPYINNDPILDMHLIIDRASVELFAKGGLVVMTEQFFPTQPFTSISLFSEHGEVSLSEGKIWPLGSIWNKK
ncbi:fructan beta-fructosidase [Mangrovibacterium marinum]|uniref:Fructan beta-fructosidase n=1 Tax=Mangrovibacterium marinum TaxID=1639118 RepID=A0A2T5C6G4_9BACT|nr:glycoside hydrolase family 32 protein [Mangrovibacterium marinum]PTN10531.1 fructan beta-fructosidase [Mangrovibacterium marinum]